MSAENIALVEAMQGQGGMGAYSPSYPDFLTDDQKCRLETIRQMRNLCDGQHERHYLWESRTKFDFPYVRANGRTQRMYLTLNLFGLISLKTADLLFGQSPLLDCDDKVQKAALQALARRTQLHSVLLNAAISGSSEGESFFEAMIHTDGKVYIRQIANETIFPVGEIQPNGQYASYVRYVSKNLGTTQLPVWLLLETTIEAGRITRVCWQLDDQMRRLKTVDVTQFDATLQPVTLTGLDMPTVVWIPNRRHKALSDYAGATDLQDKVNAKDTQCARVLMKHSDPKLALPDYQANDQGNIWASFDTFYVRNKEEIPQYIVWNAEVASAMADRDQAIKQLLVKTETSPSLLGLKDGAAPDAYKKVRLESFNSLAKASRKAIDWTAGIQLLLDLAQALENTLPGVSYPFGETSPVGVTLRDGIPVDDGDQATMIATLRAAGVMSRRRALQLQLGDESAVDAEEAELDREAADAAPTVVMGPVGEGGGTRTNPANNPGNETQSDYEADSFRAAMMRQNNAEAGHGAAAGGGRGSDES